MTKPEDVVRQGLEDTLRPDHYLAALDALVAERDEARAETQELQARGHGDWKAYNALRADNARFREALVDVARFEHRYDAWAHTQVEEVMNIARAALENVEAGAHGDEASPVPASTCPTCGSDDPAYDRRPNLTATPPVPYLMQRLDGVGGLCPDPWHGES